MLNILFIDSSEILYKKLLSIDDPDIKNLYYAKHIYEIHDIIKKYDIDFVISDITLEGMSLFPILKQVNKYNRNMPIAIYTSNSSRDNVINAANIGAAGYFLKPMDTKELLPKIKRLTAK